MMKYLLFLTLPLVGCVAAPVEGPVIGGRVVAYDPSYIWVQVKPCTPYNADPLMEWASGLNDGQNRSRSASVNVDQDGLVTCQSSESGSSRFNPKKVGLQNVPTPVPSPSRRGK